MRNNNDIFKTDNPKEKLSVYYSRYSWARTQNEPFFIDVGESPTIMQLAAISGDYPLLEFFIESGMPVEASFPAKLTLPHESSSSTIDIEANLLFLAIFSNFPEAVKMVLMFPGIDIAFRGKKGGPTALHIAALRGNVEILNLLLTEIRKNKKLHYLLDELDGGTYDSFYEWAESCNRDSSAEEWVTVAAGESPLEMAIHAKQSDIALRLIEEGARVHPYGDMVSERCSMTRAAENNMTEVVKALLEAGASPEPKVNFELSPLYFAICNKNLNMLKMLVEAGARTDVACFFNQTPIFEAIATSDQGIIDYLLEKGVSLEAEEKIDYSMQNSVLLKRNGQPIVPEPKENWSVLHKAACQLSGAMLRTLNKDHINFNQQEQEKGNTPLHLAANGMITENVEYLLEHGADVTITNFDGLTPLQVLEEAWQREFNRFHEKLSASTDAGKKKRKIRLNEVSNGFYAVIQRYGKVKALLEKASAGNKE